MTIKSAMRSQQIRDAIVTRLQQVDNIGRVQRFERYGSRKKQLADFYLWKNPSTHAEELRGWFVRRLTFRQDRPANCYERTTRWQIQGFMRLNDETQSELVFNSLIDDIEDAFRQDATLNNVITGIGDDGESGIQLVDAGPVMFSGILCHGARLQLITQDN